MSGDELSYDAPHLSIHSCGEDRAHMPVNRSMPRPESSASSLRARSKDWLISGEGTDMSSAHASSFSIFLPQHLEEHVHQGIC